MAVVVALVVGAACRCEAATHVVSKQPGAILRTIQTGIDRAVSGDTVLVEPGTYSELINFLGKTLVVTSSQGRNVTTIDGSGLGGSVVTIQNGEGVGTVLAGFTITGGTGTPDGPNSTHGGGIYAVASDPTISDCAVLNNSVGGNGFGGGLFLGSVPSGREYRFIVEDCEIAGNHSPHNAGGVGSIGNINITFTNCNVHHNSVGRGDGGGLYVVLRDGTSVTLAGNQIHHNTAGDHGGGVYIGVNGVGFATAEITWNTIWANTSEAIPQTGESGGGLWLKELRGRFANNTVVLNRGKAPQSAAWGGGVSFWDCKDLVVENNIIANNPEGGGMFCYEDWPTVIRGNILWGNGGPPLSGGCSGGVFLDANHLVDPQFCDITLGGPRFFVAGGSPALTLPGGVRGAESQPGCAGTAVRLSTWGNIKAGQ